MLGIQYEHEARGPSGTTCRQPLHARMDWLLSALHGQAAFRPAGLMAAPAPPQDFVGAMAQTQGPLSKARRTGSESGACPQGDRHRPKGLVERRRLAHARRHYQSVTGAMGPPELARSDSGPLAALLNRRVRSRTHGGVGGREGRPSLSPDLDSVTPRSQYLVQVMAGESNNSLRIIPSWFESILNYSY